MGELLAPYQDEIRLATQLCWLFFFVFTGALVFWTWRDAYRRGAMAWFWGLVVAIFNVVGWIIYIIVRPPEYADGRARTRPRDTGEGSHAAARPRDLPGVPQAGGEGLPDLPILHEEAAQGLCIECGKALKLNWAVCPYCKTKQ